MGIKLGKSQARRRFLQSGRSIHVVCTCVLWSRASQEMRNGALRLHNVYALQMKMPRVPCAASIGFHDRLWRLDGSSPSHLYVSAANYVVLHDGLSRAYYSLLVLSCTTMEPCQRVVDKEKQESRDESRRLLKQQAIPLPFHRMVILNNC